MNSATKKGVKFVSGNLLKVGITIVGFGAGIVIKTFGAPTGPLIKNLSEKCDNIDKWIDNDN